MWRESFENARLAFGSWVTQTVDIVGTHIFHVPWFDTLSSIQLEHDIEDYESTTDSDDDDDYSPTPTTSSVRKRKAATFESDEDSEDEILKERWKKAAKRPRSTSSATKKSILTKKAVEIREAFNPMSVLSKQQVNNKSKLCDLILYIIAKNQVHFEHLFVFDF